MDLGTVIYACFRAFFGLLYTIFFLVPALNTKILFIVIVGGMLPLWLN